VLIAKKALVAAHPSDGRPGSERPNAVAGKPHYGKEHSQGKELQAHVSSSWVDELWQEREEEDRCLPVQNLDENSLRSRLSGSGCMGCTSSSAAGRSPNFLIPK
jgi:hypothetical protein